jgi:hypothetical protein
MTHESSMSHGAKDNRQAAAYKADLKKLLLANLTIHTLRGSIYKLSDDMAARHKPGALASDLRAPFKTLLAKKLTEQNKVEGRPDMTGLHLEHPVPRGQVIRWLIETGVKEVELDSRVEVSVQLLSVVCWVIGGKGPTYAGSEQHALNSGNYGKKADANGHLGNVRDSMPPGWNPTDQDIWARYRWVKKQRPEANASFLCILDGNDKLALMRPVV